MPIVNARDISRKALQGGYAIAQINTNNLEWTKAILLTAEKCKSPVIIGASEGAIKYMGGYKTVASLVKSMHEDLEISVPIVLHLDHGTYEGCFKAMEAGFSSIMFDGSHLKFSDNYKKSLEIIKAANERNISVELEVGTLAGEEDGIMNLDGEQAKIEECIEIAKLNPTLLAAGIGNMHGPYPPNWKGLNIKLLSDISKSVNIPLVLHGGTGIDDESIKKAIMLGVTKINVNSELQIKFSKETRKYIEENRDLDMKSKGYDPRKLLSYGFIGILDVIENKFKLFGSAGKA